ncbi:hypothetical protein QYZ88_000140 [Lachnospiraceae bacterium C1.1]|nr:hypothetical protein [Lachnospiraceae bacterium C1.1]
MKKKIVALITAVVFVSGLSACGNSAEKEAASTGTAENISTETASSAETGGNASYASVYLKEIDELNTAGNADLFALVDVNGDEIPELAAISTEGSWDKDQVFLYTTDGSEIYLLASDIAPGLEGHYIGFFEKENLFVQSGGAAGEHYDFYKIEDSKPVKVLTADNFSIPDENGDEKIHLSINGEEVSEEEYTNSVKECMGLKGNMIKLSEVDRSEMIEMKSEINEASLIFEEAGKRDYSSYDKIKEELEKISK